MKPIHNPQAPHGPRLEIVLKCDSIGSLEAVASSLTGMTVPGVGIALVHGGVGAISKTDVLLAETAGRLIIGYQVGVTPGLEKTLREHQVEVRLYEVIYTLTGDIASLAGELLPPAPAEEIIGAARVIALFKSTRKGIIIGCEVTQGHLAVGQRFRIISAMGPVYAGTITSMHRGAEAVQKALPGQQVGLKLADFKASRIGDLVEAIRPSAQRPRPQWQPRGLIIRK